MEILLATLLALAVPTAIWLAVRYARLRRQVDQYGSLLRSAAEAGADPASLPVDFNGLEALSNAVRGLVASLDERLATIDAERAKLAAVLDQMTDGVLIVDATGRIAFLNPAAERLFERYDAVGRSVAEIVRHHRLVAAWQRCLESDEMQIESVELPARRQFLQMFAIPERYTGGSLLLVQDLTRVRRLETVRRDFVSNVSHELRTPLASLKALTETLRDGALEDPAAARRFLGRVETEVDALTQMAQELLDLSRIESGQVALELRKVKPARLLQSSAERMRAQAERAGLSLRVEVPGGMPEVSADPPRLEQVLVNLVHNAIKFTRPGGQVVLSAGAEGDFVRFAVQDSGVGIPEDVLPRIFERFYKADRARSGGGTGLGLSISRHIVEAHGGRIWAESREGQGSMFCFTIPLNR